jgi:hypothetical protein
MREKHWLWQCSNAELNCLQTNENSLRRNLVENGLVTMALN